MKKWKKNRQFKKLFRQIKEFRERCENLLKRTEAIEEFANKRIKELELKINYMEEQVVIFEKIIDSLDPKKRIN